MQRSPPAIPAQFNSRQVAFRFAFRLALLTTFASFSSQGFVVTLATLMALSAIFCSVVGTFRREVLLGPELTHWDEAAMCAVIGYMLGALA